MKSGVICENVISASTVICGDIIFGSRPSNDSLLKRSLNSGRFSSRSVRPAAYVCPPKFSSISRQDSIALYTSKPGTERAEPESKQFILVRITPGGKYFPLILKAQIQQIPY